MTRQCAVCNGRTYAGSPNNWVCSDCWAAHCPGGLPDWVRFLVNQAQYEARQGLQEYTLTADDGSTLTVLLRRAG